MEVRMKKIPSSSITPEHIYQNRRKFLKTLGIVGAGAALAACDLKGGGEPTAESNLPAQAGATEAPTATTAPSPTPTENLPPKAGDIMDELGRPLTLYEDVIGYNNYYEFTFSKTDVARASRDFPTTPWSVEVSGLVRNPRTFDMEDIYSLFDEEERIYRMRCVETWSMVIPWLGFPLHKLLEMVEPASEAKYVYFETAVDEDHMLGAKRGSFQFPYTEGLRLDEAMHDLTILSTGLYGKRLLPQNGAPLRLVVPWKYGFKSIKSIVKIKLVEDQPYTFWNNIAPQEYGFYANVNPDVPHPRWSQATETLIGSGIGRVDTLLFNGYEEEVASMYAGMDLRSNF
ncbi:MAG: protein-methionine-sulfoxide reductase catalytic subunit MsrP [Anaerolineaceae bacterium]|nr:protein-methionine-sulfoxide reductase catalytic subunit MsrP [Anaerolineaceae bacterium]